MTGALHFKVLYDGQCEICQAGVSWLQILRHFSRTELVRIFVRKPADVMPMVYEVRFYTDDRRGPDSH
jgi:predicted DCC family thiol-disulfide oxidoreductase YuxK